ncbi:neurotracting/lsamp/neurotrimin/obcam related cell adhesion molecule [Schistosoma mansoni]|uniref:neurotracting/lsamp/neurotrimin/obcam related cell adhesion molecule n=1 Tax=Schistosoma mansoni TaxID=6183 RepID=UPI00022DC3E2|nr:neurotracting/lsamp/neurotrimin/obcam related cell adhesion molecule [Schistosoma mansoni]|eukprot:XP_018649409.1 neurotracting/lsamp/neurotrimin/obcam related cell adhesion molecule [Schistosoma mansoni]
MFRLSFTAYELNPDSVLQLELSDPPNNLSVPINSTLYLRCQIPVEPKQSDSIYVIWRFRHSHKDPAPNIWSFIHKDDDLARCPEPPNTCEFVNQYSIFNKFNQSPFNNPIATNKLSATNDIELIQRRQLFTLTLTNLQSDMNGLFQCHTLVNLDAYDKRGYLNILAPPQYPLEIVRIDDTMPPDTELFNYSNTLGRTFTIISGKLYYFSCLITHANPKPVVTWFIRHSNGEIRELVTFNNLNYSKQLWKPFSNYVDTQTSDVLTHEDDGTFLKCTAKNSMGLASSEEVNLNIEYVPIIYPFESNAIRVLETTSFKQVCRSKANPSAQIYWVDENQNLVSNNSLLDIHHVSRNGPKYYKCVASNEIGETNLKLLVDVLYPPTVHVQSKVTVNEGEALEIACRVDANPVASSIYWTYNKFPDQTRIRDQSTLHWFQSKRIDGSVLKIPHTYPYHAGQYFCHADAEIYMPKDLWLSQNLSTSSEVWSIWKQRSRSFAAVNLTINYSPGQPTLTVVYSTNNKGEDYIILRCQENSSGKPVLINKPNEKMTLEFQNFHTIEQNTTNQQDIIQNLLEYTIHMIPDNTMNCTFISSLSPDVQWLFHSYHNLNDLNQILSMNRSILKQWTQNYIIKNRFGLWEILTTLNFQFNDMRLYMKNSLNKIFKKLNDEFPDKLIPYSWDYQVLKQLFEFLIILQFEGNYLCESSNSMGIEHGLINLRVQKSPTSIISFSEATSISISEQDAYRHNEEEIKLHGPLFCQFYGKPVLNQIKWWRYTGLNYHEQNTPNQWELIYKTENFNKSIHIEETSSLLIITGTPAFITSSRLNFTMYGRQSSYENLVHNLEKITYRFTMFTMLWLKKFNHKDYGYYKCQSKNEIGSFSETRRFQRPSGYHSSPVNISYQDLRNDSVNKIRNKIQNLLSIWLKKIQDMQQYSISLEDHGITSFLTNGTESHLLEPSKSLNNSDIFNGSFSGRSSDVDLSNIKGRKTNNRKIVQSEFLINTEGQNYINISGLMPNHLYTVTISRISKHGKSKPSRPLAFRTKFFHLEPPGPIHLEETKELIQFSKGNPALCAQVEVGTINNDSSRSSTTTTTTWNLIHFSLNYSPYIIINNNVFHSETNNRYVELSNCKPLSWDHYTEIPIRLQNKFHFRARYCIYGYSTMCTEYMKPIKDISTHIVIVAALLCITLVVSLSSMFVYLICKHLKKNYI